EELQMTTCELVRAVEDVNILHLRNQELLSRLDALEKDREKLQELTDTKNVANKQLWSILQSRQSEIDSMTTKHQSMKQGVEAAQITTFTHHNFIADFHKELVNLVAGKLKMPFDMVWNSGQTIPGLIGLWNANKTRDLQHGPRLGTFGEHAAAAAAVRGYPGPIPQHHPNPIIYHQHFTHVGPTMIPTTTPIMMPTTPGGLQQPPTSVARTWHSLHSISPKAPLIWDAVQEGTMTVPPNPPLMIEGVNPPLGTWRIQKDPLMIDLTSAGARPSEQQENQQPPLEQPSSQVPIPSEVRPITATTTTTTATATATPTTTTTTTTTKISSSSSSSSSSSPPSSTSTVHRLQSLRSLQQSPVAAVLTAAVIAAATSSSSTETSQQEQGRAVKRRFVVEESDVDEEVNEAGFGLDIRNGSQKPDTSPITTTTTTTTTFTTVSGPSSPSAGLGAAPDDADATMVALKHPPTGSEFLTASSESTRVSRSRQSSASPGTGNLRSTVPLAKRRISLLQKE
ncbi:hypothetical protein BGZ65_010291, partial [Modicella reniformis]